MTPLSLTDWQNFYVITGSAAAGLTGLTFVVIALAANRRRMTMTGMRAYVTPTIVHLGTVLALAAFLTVPRQGLGTLGLGFGVAGLAGVVYGGAIAISMRRVGSAYVPVVEDWVWHVALPTLAYGALLVIGFLVEGRTEGSLCGVAAVSVALLFIGIHNAWDVAVSVSIGPPSDTSKDPHKEPPKETP